MVQVDPHGLPCRVPYLIYIREGLAAQAVLYRPFYRPLHICEKKQNVTHPHLPCFRFFFFYLGLYVYDLLHRRKFVGPPTSDAAPKEDLHQIQSPQDAEGRTSSEDHRRSSEGPGTLQCSHQSPRYVGKGAACLDALDIITLEELVSAGISRPKTPKKAPLVGRDEGYEDVWTNTQPMRSARARERIRRR